MKIKAFIKRVVPVFFVLAVGIVVGIIGSTSAKAYFSSSADVKSQYQTNEFGETYGSAIYATSIETEPDLIKAYGVDGTIGYVRSADLLGEEPKTPEEALALQSKNAKSGEKEIPLYASDGKTVIGKFILSSPQVVEFSEKTDE